MASWPFADAPRRVLMTCVRVYRFALSPWLGNSCRFEPTCSVYALEALSRHGAAVGSALTLHRLARCQPWCACGHDPVPEKPFRLFAPRQPGPSTPNLSKSASFPDQNHP